MVGAGGTTGLPPQAAPFAVRSGVVDRQELLSWRI